MGTSRRALGSRATEKHIIVVEAAEQSCHTWDGPIRGIIITIQDERDESCCGSMGKGHLRFRVSAGRGCLSGCVRTLEHGADAVSLLFWLLISGARASMDACCTEIWRGPRYLGREISCKETLFPASGWRIEVRIDGYLGLFKVTIACLGMYGDFAPFL